MKLWENSSHRAGLSPGLRLPGCSGIWQPGSSPSGCSGSRPRWLPATGAAAAWDGLLAGQAAATEELLFPDRKIKIPGENMPILQKELFLVKSLSDQPRF